jgi:glycosyltransferase involved in cell wall biosynthesis
MKRINGYIVYSGDEAAAEQTERSLSESPLVSRIFRIEEACSSAAVRRIANLTDMDYTLLYMRPEGLQTGLLALERLAEVADSSGADMLYSDYCESDGGKRIPHPVIDYQRGSLRDDFHFGPLLFFRTAALREAAGRMDADYRYAGLYDLRLKLSQRCLPLHVNEYLYTADEKDRRRSGEKLFDYVHPDNRAIQIEMEAACTAHLKQTGGYLPPQFKAVNFEEEVFETEASVIIPVRNRVETIEKAIRSALGQETSFPYNLIVIDNHSTDGTGEAIEACNTPGFVRDSACREIIHIIPERNDLGIGGCWNVGVHHPACGKFAVQLDSDDVYSDGHTLQKIVDAFYAQRCAMVVGTYRLTDFAMETIPPGVIDHREWTPDNGRNNALRINGLGAPRAFYTPVLRRIHFPDTSYGEDYAVCLRISRDYPVGRIYDVLYLCRRWRGNSDASVDIETQNRYDAYKDRIRTWELSARRQSQSSAISSARVNRMLQEQLEVWPLAGENYKAYETICSRRVDMGGFTVEVQYNPSRMPPAGIKPGGQCTRQRKCFLCCDNLPREQRRLAFGEDYFVLCNPYPIFPEHFTIPTREHAGQEIASRFGDFLELARRLDAHTVFYNGPKSGASAPDHVHFQAVTRRRMPVEWELDERIAAHKAVPDGKGGAVYALTGYLRNGFVVKAQTADRATALFRLIYHALDVAPGETEPRMNLLGMYNEGEGWTIVIIPRRQHRPWQCFAEGEEQFLSSPGAADMGGIFITLRKEDFERVTPDILRDIYGQVCYPDAEIEKIIDHIRNLLQVCSKTDKP